MTVLDDLHSHLRYLEERSALVDTLREQLEAAHRATREARRQLAVSEGLRKTPMRGDTAATLNDVLTRLASGATLAQIAADLNVGDSAVRQRVSRIYRKYGVRTHFQAVIAAIREGDINPDDLPGDWLGEEPTEQQRRVLQGVADHGTNEAVGEALGISLNTVAVHLQRMVGKSGTSVKMQNVVRAYKKGWIE